VDFVVYAVSGLPNLNGVMLMNVRRIKMDSNTKDRAQITEAKRQVIGRMGVAGIAVFLMFILAVIIHLNATDKTRKETAVRYEAEISQLKEGHKRAINDTIEVYERAKAEYQRQVEHTESLAKLARIQDEAIRFQMALTGAIIELQPKLDRKIADRISSEIVSECKEKGLDPILVAALIWVESEFDVMAHSSKGAVGLMQVRYSTWKETPVLKDNGVSAKYKLYWIDLNIKCGTEILAKYYNEAESNMAKALYRYNTGSKDLPDNKSITDIEYVNRIMLTAYEISDFIRKGKSTAVEES
jgi:soluble lytic murein transglycosylase